MRNKIISIAQAEVGYKEGANNANKYSKELYNKAQEWCNDFVCWVMRKAGVGTDKIPAFSYVPSTAEWFDKKGQYKNSKAFGGNYTPQTADLIVFDYNHNSTSDHIGLIEKVEGGKVYTVEGNKDNQVKRCVYDLSSRDIRAYLVPSYPVIKKEINGQVADIQRTLNNRYGLGIVVDNIFGSQTKKALIKALQKEIGAVVDGIFGNQTKSKCPTIKKGTKGNVVYLVQAMLVCRGYSITVDGVFGSQTESIVKQFQKNAKISIDGIVGKQTFSTLFK